MRNQLSFDQLEYASRVCHATLPYLLRVQEWNTKRQHVALYLHDLPMLVDDYARQTKTPHPTNPNAVVFDAFPRLRLAAACEALAECVYSMAEVAASVAHHASNRVLPNSFNDICKKVAAKKLDPALATQLPDLSWYARVREIRTEWCHHSGVFVAGVGADPILCIRAYRRKHSDQVYLKGTVQMRPRELIEWCTQARLAVDRFGSAIFWAYILPSMPLAEKVYMPKFDELGFPLVVDGRLMGEQVTVREYLGHAGIQVPAK